MDTERPTDLQSPLGNPWRGFAHTDHQADEYEPLLRTLRFASIEFNKFWIGVNAFPVFMNSMKGASIREIERLFGWLQASPAWAERVQCPRLISALGDPALKEIILAFARDVRRVRELRTVMAGIQQKRLPDVANVETALAQVISAQVLCRQLALEEGCCAAVQERIAEVSARLNRNRTMQRFFSRVAFEGALPEPLSLGEAGCFFQVTDLIQKTPPAVYAWRQAQIIGPEGRALIETWQNLARSTLEIREKIQHRMRLEEPITSEELMELSGKMGSTGIFRAFNSEYKKARKRYRDLLQISPGTKGFIQESPAIMARNLANWARYLDEKDAFEANAEASAFFAPLFRGIDTDFVGALAAHDWALSLRTELKAADSAFCAKLLDAVSAAPEARLKLAAHSCGGGEVKAVQLVLLESEYASGRDFAVVGCEDEAQLVDATYLRALGSTLGLSLDVRFSELSDLRAAMEELLAILKRLDANTEIKGLLKTMYLGEDTDLSLIDQAMSYVAFIDDAGLPEALRGVFLTTYGPQRILDSGAMVTSAWAGLAVVKDHLQRLDVATHGQSRNLIDQPLLALITRIQQALKQPARLAEWIQSSQNKGHA